MEIEDNVVDTLQIYFEDYDLFLIINSKYGWNTNFIHNPWNKLDRVNVPPVLYPEPIWMDNAKRDKEIKRNLKMFGIAKDDIELIIPTLLSVLIDNDMIKDIQGAPMLGETNVSGDCEQGAEVWFMIKNKFSAKLMTTKVVEAFEEQHHRIRTVKESKKILIFNEGIYINGEDEIERLIRDFLGDAACIKYVAETMAEIRAYTLVLFEQFNPPHYINLLNGVYDVRMKTFMDTESGVYDKADMLFTKRLSVYYNRDATCPNITTFFNWAQPNELYRETVFEQFAYVFHPGHPIQRMFMYFGGGNNGKSVAMGILEKMIGHLNVSGWSIESLENNANYSQADVVEKMANVCGELPDKKVRLDFIKMCTGGDPVSVRPIWGKPYQVVNSTKFFFIMNKMVEITDYSEGATRRLIIIVWNQEVEGKDLDIDLISKLTTEEELSGFFNVLMDSYDNLIERGHFLYNPSTEETEKVLADLHGDDVNDFIQEKCILDKNNRRDTKAFYEDYVNYCNSHMNESMGKKAFNAHLRNMGYKTVRYANGAAVAWAGIGIREESRVKSITI